MREHWTDRRSLVRLLAAMRALRRECGSDAEFTERMRERGWVRR
jgi:hypothetical protein